AADRTDKVAGLEAGCGGSGAGTDTVDAALDDLLAEDEAERRQDKDGEDKVRDRACGVGRRAGEHVLVVEADPALFTRHRRERLCRRRARLAIVAKELDVAAERHG